MKVKGKVYLIGAGCGDWELITVKGLKYLKSCNCVIYDRLISERLLEFVPKGCKKIYVGKRCGNHSKTQEEINQTLVDMALEGYTVARLKGGDPFVFGRGGEEVQALQKHDIPYEVIPGVSSSIAVPTSVGIPVTHRGISRSFHVITGHTLNDSLEDFSVIAKLEGTLIFLMSLKNLERVCNGLVSNGMDINTPCAIISKGTTREERVFRGNLSNIVASKPMVEPPTIFIVGETTSFDFKSNVEHPLKGINVAVTGTESFTTKLDAKLSQLGADVTKLNHMEIISHYENIPQDFSEYTHIVFTSTNGVDIFFKYLKDIRSDIRKVIDKEFITIGSSTADTLSKYGIYADTIPEKFTSMDLANLIVRQSSEEHKYLILRASNGSNVLTDILKEHNVNFEDVDTYTLICNGEVLKQDFSHLDYITFGSSLGVKEFFKYRALPSDVEIIAIGEVCKSTLDSLGLKNTIHMAETYDVDGIVDKILEVSNR